MNPWGLLLVAGGLLSLGAAAFNWDWLFNRRPSRFFVRILGRVGLRILLGLLGIALAALGLFLTAGIVAIYIGVALVAILALQLWVARTARGDLLNAYVVRGPPDGG